MDRPAPQPSTFHMSYRSLGENFKSLVQTEENTLYFISFWGHWCAPCLAELPHLVPLSKELDQSLGSSAQLKIKSLFINTDRSSSDHWQAGQDWWKAQKFGIESLTDEELKWKKVFNPQIIPYHALVSASGILYWESAGAKDWSSKKLRAQFIEFVKAVELKILQLEAPDASSANGQDQQ